MKKFLECLVLRFVLVSVIFARWCSYENNIVNAADKEQEKSVSFIDVKISNPDKISINARDANPLNVLKIIREKIGAQFEIITLTEPRIVTVNFSELELREAIAQLVSNNYALLFDAQSHDLKKIFILSEWSGTSMVVIHEQEKAANIFPRLMSEDDRISGLFIQGKRRCFDNFSKQYPEKEIAAQISFQDFFPASEVLPYLMDHQLIVSSLNHGWGEMRGGYAVNHNLSKEEIIHDLNQKHDNFLKMAIKDSEDLLYKTEDLKRRQRTEEFIREIKEQLLMVEQGVVRIYGAEVKGNANTLKKLFDDPKIRVLDSIECSEGVKNLLRKEGYDTKMILIPIEPE